MRDADAILSDGPLGTAVCLPIILTALLVIRPSAKDLAPYMPLSAAMGIVVIVYVIPWAREVFRAPNITTLGDIYRAGHRSRISESDGASMDSDSIRSSAVSLWILSHFIRSDPDPMELEHIGHAGEYDRSTIPAAWETMSDLESGLHHASSTTSEDSRDQLLI